MCSDIAESYKQTTGCRPISIQIGPRSILQCAAQKADATGIMAGEGTFLRG